MVNSVQRVESEWPNRNTDNTSAQTQVPLSQIAVFTEAEY